MAEVFAAEGIRVMPGVDIEEVSHADGLLPAHPAPTRS